MDSDNGLDVAEIGRALVMVAVISRLLGHDSMAGTVQSYLAPHGAAPTAEKRFVRDVLLGENPISEEEAIAALQGVQLPELST